MKDYYAILGIKPGASDKEIREAYHLRVRVVHPDRFDQKAQPVEWKQANEMLAEINDAYSKLKKSPKPSFEETREERQDVQRPGPSEAKAYGEPYNYADLAEGEAVFQDLPKEIQDLFIREIKKKDASWFAVKNGSVLLNYIFLIVSLYWFVLLFKYPKGRADSGLEFILITLAASAIAAFNFDRVYRWHFSKLNSYIVLTPLYFMNIDFDIIKFRPLWLLKDIDMAHHHKNGSDAGTTVKLIYENRSEKIHFNSMRELENFCGMYDKYVDNIRYQSRHGNAEYFQKEDIFFNIRERPGKKRSYWGKVLLYGMSLFLGMNAFFLAAPAGSGMHQRLWTYNPANYHIKPVKDLPDEKPLPPNGWSKDYSDAAGIAPLTIESPGNENYFVKITDWKTDKEIKTIFVRSGETAETKLPLGNYRMKFASGEKWYGEDYAFGNTEFKALSDELGCTRNGNIVTGYTVHLYQEPPYGKLDTREIGREEF